ncbi:hypothetical protein TL16_g06707 [Triparma laevis f. inornata]|uniref:Uncharacterized protein n=2 Tax=Triparma laevis TaxID=1534972 RepID=A0A9W7FUD6_9STRA|nr:hypothetical protein TL16_g06707 [Triparma laevis f. inornata]GMI18419.1 hypothetical protein TrLO_g5261 [Triparma laevis f. longispina]
MPGAQMSHPPPPPLQPQPRLPTKTVGISQSSASAARLTKSTLIRKSKKERRTATRRNLQTLSTVTSEELTQHLTSFLNDQSYRRAPHLDNFIALMSQPHGFYPLSLLNQCVPHLTSLLPVTIPIFQTLSTSFPPQTLHLENIIPYVSPPHSLVIRNTATRIFSNCAATAEGRELMNKFNVTETLCNILFDVDPQTLPTSLQTYEDIMFFFSNQAQTPCSHCRKVLNYSNLAVLRIPQNLEAFYWFLCFMSGNSDFFHRRQSVLLDYKILQSNQKDTEPWLRYVGNILTSGDGWNDLALSLPLSEMDAHVLRGLVMGDGEGANRVMEFCLNEEARPPKYAEVVFNGVKRGWRRGVVEYVKQKLPSKYANSVGMMEEAKWLIEICRVALTSVEEWDQLREGIEQVMSDWEGKNDELVERACDIVDHWEEEEEAEALGAAVVEPEVQGNEFKFGLNPSVGMGNQPFDFNNGGGVEHPPVPAADGMGRGRGRGRGMSNKPSWMM